MVADRPGSDPITSPYTEAASIAMTTSHVEISAKASIRVLSMDHHGIGSSPAGSGTRNSFEKIRWMPIGASTASGSESFHRAPSAVAVAYTISAAVMMKPSRSAAAT